MARADLKATFEEIKSRTPPELAERLAQSHEKFQERLAAIAGGPRLPSAPGEAPGGAAGG